MFGLSFVYLASVVSSQDGLEPLCYVLTVQFYTSFVLRSGLYILGLKLTEILYLQVTVELCSIYFQVVASDAENTWR